MTEYAPVTQRRVTVTTAATAIHGATPLAVRKLTLRNGSLVNISLCDEAGTPGITLEPTDVREYTPPPGEEGLYGLRLWATVASGTATLEVEEWV